MTKTKSTKRALILSALSLVLCVSMLIGSTYAWFTDTVSSVNNIITSGNLDVELEYSVDGENWIPVTEETSIFSEDALWEPGYTQAVALKVKNVGSLALKYSLFTNIALEKVGTNVYGDMFKLSDYLEVYACGPQANNQIGEILTSLVLGNRDKALGNGTSMTKAAFNADLAENSYMQPAEEHVVCLAITMPTTVGNEANHKTGTEAPFIRFGIHLYATQFTSESDSFDNQYDADAEYEGLPMANVTDFGAKEVPAESLFGDWFFENGTSNRIDDLYLDTSFKFVASDIADKYADLGYDEWIADYEVTSSVALPENAAILAGQYDFIDDYYWQAFQTPAVEAGVANRLLGSQGFKLTYKDCVELVKEFNCGLQDVNLPAGAEITVALKIYQYDANDTIIAEHTVGVFTYVAE